MFTVWRSQYFGPCLEPTSVFSGLVPHFVSVDSSRAQSSFSYSQVILSASQSFGSATSVAPQQNNSFSSCFRGNGVGDSEVNRGQPQFCWWWTQVSSSLFLLVASCCCSTSLVSSQYPAMCPLLRTRQKKQPHKGYFYQSLQFLKMKSL